MVAPAYTEDTYVDHALSTNLDSTFAFEGPEKLLEIWFWPSPETIPENITREGLRAIPLEKWKTILDLVSCKILSMKSSASVDAYLLSESSLFVFPHKLVLKTCGTTTTLACIEEIFDTARVELNLDNSLDSKSIYKVFYSRRSFMFPEKQKHVHTDWKREVQLLNQHFVSGKSYVVGDFTSDDHWYLYMGGNGSPNSVPGFSQDQTFEMLMTRLDPKKMRQFVTTRVPGTEAEADDSEEHDSGHDDGQVTFVESRLANLFDEDSVADMPSSATSNPIPSPQLSDTMELSDIEDAEKSAPEFINDAFAFTPCGFSSNSIAKGAEGYYYTLHITPESGWSYASFETNFSFSSNPNIDIVSVMLRVLNIFMPGKFSLTLFTDSGDRQGHQSFDKLANSEAALQKMGYVKHEKIIYDLKGDYNLLYLNFEKN